MLKKSMTASPEKDRHLSFLRNEFSGNNFLLDDKLKMNDILLLELLETIFEPSFEGRTPTHGALICSHPFEHYTQNLPRATWVPQVGSDGRVYCDGIKTFRVIGPSAEGVVSFTDRYVLNELDLFTIRDDALFKNGGEDHESELEKDLFLIKKSPSGEIIVLCDEGIAVHRDARLSFFRYQYHFKKQLTNHIRERWGKNPWQKQTLDSILRLAIHILAAEPGVGGTIILLHPNDDIADGKLNTSSSIRMPSELEITFRDHQSLLVSLMKNTDGAVLIDNTGRVLSARNWLVIPYEKMSAAGNAGGTRHLTARLFSNLIEGLVFVISSDGPVTLYSAGSQVFRTCERR